MNKCHQVKLFVVVDAGYHSCRQQQRIYFALHQPHPAMADFLGGTNDFDEFERASSAFPDISLDGSSDIPSTVPQPAKQSSVGFSFDDFDTEPVPTTNNNVKVTGDDEIEKFESEFPEIEVASPVPAPTIPVRFRTCCFYVRRGLI